METADLAAQISILLPHSILELHNRGMLHNCIIAVTNGSISQKGYVHSSHFVSDFLERFLRNDSPIAININGERKGLGTIDIAHCICNKSIKELSFRGHCSTKERNKINESNEWLQKQKE
jgi:hypothetical protein